MVKLLKQKLWLTPALIILILFAVVTTTALVYHQTEKIHEAEKSFQIASAISKSMSRELEYRLQALKVVSSNIRKAPTKNEFDYIARTLQSEYSGFFAINFVSPDGVIQRIHPYDENKLAEGRNLLERSDVSQYLIDSKNDGQPRASHRLLTYQKIHAVVLYVPLYDTSKKFLGWMNGVLSIDHCLTSYMQDPNLANVSARLRWQHPSETSLLEYNWNNPDTFQTSEHKIMNQLLSVDLSIAESLLDGKRNKLYLTTIVLRFFMLITISFLVILLSLSKIKLQATNEQLSFKNNMLNSLSHDMANPLMTLNLVIEAAVSKGELSISSREKISRLLKVIDGMLKSVRLLHSYNSGVKSIPIENVSVLTSVTEAIHSIDQIAEAKKIIFEISPELDASLQIKGNEHTLINNVLLNGLSNAIKFSPQGGIIKISHSIDDTQLSLIITDQGNGLAENELKRFRLLSSIDSRKGTQGEIGTGLGLLQIVGFMKIYGGRVNLENNEPHGTKLTLIFERA